MTRLLLLLALALPAALQPGCQHPASERVVEVQTLKSVGQAAEAAVSLTGQLLRDGRITPVQAKQVLELYDGKFQPAFKVAVKAVQSDLSPASPDVLSLGNQVLALVLQLQTTR